MATKYKLLDTLEEFEAKDAEMKSLLSIPDNAGTNKYAEPITVDSPDHADYGMFIFPVHTEGKWKCDQHFGSDELVDYDYSWTETMEEE
jgi:hypothetical protein